MADKAASGGQQGSGGGILPLAGLVAGAVAIAFAGIFLRLSPLGPTATGFHRMGLAVPFMVVWVLWERRSRSPEPRPATRRDYRDLVLAGLLFAGDMAVWHVALLKTTVANATLLANFAPVVVTLGGWLLFGSRCTGTFLLGLGLGMGGALLLLGESLELGGEKPLGDLLGLTTALFYGSYILTVSRLRLRFPTGAIMLWPCAVGSVALLGLAVIQGETLLPAEAAGWLPLLGLAVVPQVTGQGLIAYALAHLPPSFSSVTLLIQPVSAAVLAWIILGETLTTQQMMGGLVVLAGILLARRGSR